MDTPRAPRVELAASFTHEGVARAYRHRPPYPDEVFDILLGLMDGRTRAVLDLGAGEGALARPLAARLAGGAEPGRVDAVDISAAMVAEGQQRPGGRAGNLRWFVSPAEESPLDGPYGLVTAGASLHWMPWERTLGRVAEALDPGGWLVVVEHGVRDEPWREPMLEVIREYTRSRDHDPRFSVVEALADAGLLTLAGRVETAPVTFRQPVAAYVEAHHSTSSLARELMSDEEAAGFGAAVADAVRPWTVDGHLDLPVRATVSWGRPSGNRSPGN